MLSKLQNIRCLLTEPNATNIRNASEGLQELVPYFEALATRLATQRELAPEGADPLIRLRAQLSAIAALSQKASEYFNCLGRLKATNFGAYGRSGVLKSL